MADARRRDRRCRPGADRGPGDRRRRGPPLLRPLQHALWRAALAEREEEGSGFRVQEAAESQIPEFAVGAAVELPHQLGELPHQPDVPGPEPIIAPIIINTSPSAEPPLLATLFPRRLVVLLRSGRGDYGHGDPRHLGIQSVAGGRRKRFVPGRLRIATPHCRANRRRSLSGGSAVWPTAAGPTRKTRRQRPSPWAASTSWSRD